MKLLGGLLICVTALAVVLFVVVGLEMVCEWTR